METDSLLTVNVKSCDEAIEDNRNQAILASSDSGVEHPIQHCGVDNFAHTPDVEAGHELVQSGDDGEVDVGGIPQQVGGLQGVGVDGDDGPAGAGHDEAAAP